MNKETCYDPHKNKRPACADKCKKCGNLPAPDGKINVDDNYDPCPVCEPADGGEFVKEARKSYGYEIRKIPVTHGPCCTCQVCGFPTDGECLCDENTIVEALDIISTLTARIKGLENKLCDIEASGGLILESLERRAESLQSQLEAQAEHIAKLKGGLNRATLELLDQQLKLDAARGALEDIVDYCDLGPGDADDIIIIKGKAEQALKEGDS